MINNCGVVFNFNKRNFDNERGEDKQHVFCNVEVLLIFYKILARSLHILQIILRESLNLQSLNILKHYFKLFCDFCYIFCLSTQFTTLPLGLLS